MLYNFWDPVLFILVLYNQTAISDFLGKGLLIFRTLTIGLNSGDAVIRHLTCQVLDLLVFVKIRGREEKCVLYLQAFISQFPFLFFSFPFKCSYTDLKCFVIVTVTYTKECANVDCCFCTACPKVNTI